VHIKAYWGHIHNALRNVAAKLFAITFILSVLRLLFGDLAILLLGDLFVFSGGVIVSFVYAARKLHSIFMLTASKQPEKGTLADLYDKTKSEKGR